MTALARVRDEQDVDERQWETDPPLEDDIPPDDFDNDDDHGRDDGDDDDDDEREPVRWVTVASFWQSPQAHIARLKLQGEGIDCVIIDENLVAMDWFFANAVGGIKIQVPQDQVIRAREVLNTQTNARPTSDEPIFDGQLRCPRCGGEEISAVRFSKRIAFLSILLLGMPLPIFRKTRHCDDCGFEWRQ